MSRKIKIVGIILAGIFLIVLLLFGQRGGNRKLSEIPSNPPAGNPTEPKAEDSNLNLQQLPEKNIFEKNVLNLSGNKISEGSASLSWNANSEPDLAGYKIYYGPEPRTGNCPPGGYPQKVDSGNKISYTINNLEIGKTYYFSLASYDKSGNESCFSQEVKKIITKN